MFVRVNNFHKTLFFLTITYNLKVTIIYRLRNAVYESCYYEIRLLCQNIDSMFGWNKCFRFRSYWKSNFSVII